MKGYRDILFDEIERLGEGRNFILFWGCSSSWSADQLLVCRRKGEELEFSILGTFPIPGQETSRYRLPDGRFFEDYRKLAGEELVALIGVFLDEIEKKEPEVMEDTSTSPFQKRQERPVVRFIPTHSYPDELYFEVQGVDMVYSARLIGSFDIEFECLTLI